MNAFYMRRAELLLHQAREFCFEISCDHRRFLHMAFTDRHGYSHIYSASSIDGFIHELALEIWGRPPETEERLALKEILSSRLALFRRLHPESRVYVDLSTVAEKGVKSEN